MSRLSSLIGQFSSGGCCGTRGTGSQGKGTRMQQSAPQGVRHTGPQFERRDGGRAPARPPKLMLYELRCQNDALARMSRDELPTMRRYCPLGLTQPLRGSLHTDRSLRSSVSVTVER
jgi:hypothetical protein